MEEAATIPINQMYQSIKTRNVLSNHIPFPVPFRHWIVDHFCIPLSGLPDVDWTASYQNDIERNKFTTVEIPNELRSIDETLQEVWKWASRDNLFSDPTRHGAGLHRMDPGGWLQVHLDYNRHPKCPAFARRLNAIVFLHPRWEPGWGGRLLLCNPIGETVKAIDPLPGRLIIFETSDISYHGVEEISRDAQPRLSLATYFLGVAEPQETRLRALFLPNRNTPYAPKEVRLS